MTILEGFILGNRIEVKVPEGVGLKRVSRVLKKRVPDAFLKVNPHNRIIKLTPSDPSRIEETALDLGECCGDEEDLIVNFEGWSPPQNYFVNF